MKTVEHHQFTFDIKINSLFHEFVNLNRYINIGVCPINLCNDQRKRCYTNKLINLCFEILSSSFLKSSLKNQWKEGTYRPNLIPPLPPSPYMKSFEPATVPRTQTCVTNVIVSFGKAASLYMGTVNFIVFPNWFPTFAHVERRTISTTRRIYNIIRRSRRAIRVARQIVREEKKTHKKTIWK